MEPHLSPEVLHRLLRWAACSVRAALRGEEPAAGQIPEAALRGGAGVFVTLREAGRLAGCIGFVQSEASLWETTAEAARGAALDDPRFERLTPDRLGRVEVEVSVLSAPHPIVPEAVEVGRHGLLLEGPSWQRGLLLPQVAVEHGLDREAFLHALARKAGMSDRAWEQPGAVLKAFTVQQAAGSLMALCAEEEGP